MPLPILQSPLSHSPADLYRLYLRCDHHLVSYLAEEETQLDIGTALTNPALPTAPDANHLRDAALPPDTSPESALAEVTAHFASRNLRCAHYILNPSSPPDQTTPLRDHLLATGHVPETLDILRLTQAPHAYSLDTPAGLKIIPARASYRHARDLAAEGAATPDVIESRMAHIENPHFDCLLVLKDGRAIAQAGILAVGDMGLIAGVHVTPAHRRQGLARLLLSRVLEIAARSLFKHVFLDVAPTNTPAQSLYASTGFQKFATHTLYRAPWTKP